MLRFVPGSVRRLVRSSVLVLALSSGALAQLEVKTVPWQGDPILQHQVFDGGTLFLQGVAVPAAGCSLVSATWDPGDGSAPIPVSVANPRVLEATHVYNGANNQPYTAVLSVTDSCGTTVTDTFRVVVATKTLDVEVNMAIDKGLWYLHKRQVLGSVGGVPTGYWQSTSQPFGYNTRAAASGSAVQALQIHGHLATGNGAEDPYVEDVQRGLAHLMTELQSFAIGAQTYGDPDANGNGLGLWEPFSGRSIYTMGQLIDGIVASDTPGAVATTGGTDVIGRTYGEIVQDLIDAYSWGQADGTSSPRGGWRYGLNDQSADNSACQWMAIGAIAAERIFGTTIPPFVKDQNRDYWLAQSQYLDGSFAGFDGHLGYSTVFHNVDVQMMNTTPSGVVQMVMDGVPSSDPRFVGAVGYMARNWNQLVGPNNRIYGLFATAKAMRLALPAPVGDLTSGALSFDWYRAQAANGDPYDGSARHLVDRQQSDGSWDGYFSADDLATAWSAIILSSSPIDPNVPVAICEADPELTAANFPVNFDGSQSFHAGPAGTIVNYEWDFEGDGTYDATGVNATHSYPAEGIYDATLRVTDDSVPPKQSVDSCQIEITPPPFPPDADPGSVYAFCQQVQPWILDGSGSTDPDGTIVLYEWDFSPQPLDGSFDATGSTVDVTAFFSGLPPGVYDIALRVTDDVGNTNTDFTFVRVLDFNDPDCSVAPPVLVCPPDFTDIWAGGIPAGQADPSNTGTATYTTGCTIGVNLSWTDVSIVPNTPQTFDEPEVVITRRWTLVDGCGGFEECDQTITLLSPAGLLGHSTVDAQPNECPNELSPTTGVFTLAIPGTYVYPAQDIVPGSVVMRRADGVGRQIKPGQLLLGPTYDDLTRPYYFQDGPCAALGRDGRPDLVFTASAKLLRRAMKLNALPDGTQVRLIVTGQRTNGETFSLTEWIVARD